VDMMGRPGNPLFGKDFKTTLPGVGRSYVRDHQQALSIGNSDLLPCREPQHAHGMPRLFFAQAGGAIREVRLEKEMHSEFYA